jgi:hypothetical protein
MINACKIASGKDSSPELIFFLAHMRYDGSYYFIQFLDRHQSLSFYLLAICVDDRMAAFKHDAALNGPISHARYFHLARAALEHFLVDPGNTEG